MTLSARDMKLTLETLVWFPGWRLEVYETPFQGACLAVSAEVTNSYNPEEKVALRIKTLLPPFETQADFLKFLRWRLAQIAVHESDEALRDVNTLRPIFDPHDESATEPA